MCLKNCSREAAAILEEYSMKNRRKGLLIAGLLIGQIIIFVGAIISSNFYYQTNDDTTIIALASGAYGSPSIYLDNIHVFLSYIFKLLFTYLPVVNWITIFFIIMLFASFFSIDCMAANLMPDSKLSNYLAAFSIIEVCWFLVITYFTFTIVSYVCGIAGLLCWIYSLFLKTNEKKFFISGTILIFVSTLIRAEVLKSLILVLILVLAFWAYKKKKMVQAAFVAVVPLMAMVVMTAAHTAIYNMNDVQKEFWQWGEIRSAAVDSAPVDYETYKDEFQQIGVDENIYQMIYNQYYFDYEAVSKDIFSNLKEMNSATEKYNFNLFEILGELFGIKRGFLYYERFYLILLLGTVIFALINSRHKKLEILLLVLSTLCTTWLFYFIKRPVYRVIMPNYLLAALLILFIILQNAQSEKNSSDSCENKSKVWNYCANLIVCILPIMVVVSFGYFNPEQKLDKVTRHNQERQQIYKYLEANEDKLYLSGNLSVYSIDVCRPVLEFAGQNARWNLIGNWETFSVPYYDLLSHYDIENPDRLALELPDSDTLRIISNQGLGYIEFASFFDNYIEGITNRSVEIVPEEYIATLPDGEWWTFRVVYTD